MPNQSQPTDIFSNFQIRGKKLILAISGGPDSIYLLHQLLLFQKKYDYQLFLAHFNHCTRGKESDLDEKFIQKIADQYQLPIFIEKLNNSKQLSKKSEDYLRQHRYDFLNKIKNEIKADFILTAHHRDDNIETIIHNFIRGTGPIGLTGISPIHDFLLRPLLHLSKPEIISFLHKNKITYRLDVSNQDTEYTRNYIRHQLMPHIQKINPNYSQSITNLSNIIAEHESIITQIVKNKIKYCTISKKHYLKPDIYLKKFTANHIIKILDYKKFNSYQSIIKTEIIKQIILPHIPTDKQLTSGLIYELQNILDNSPGGSKKIMFDTLCLEKKNGKITLYKISKN